MKNLIIALIFGLFVINTFFYLSVKLNNLFFLIVINIFYLINLVMLLEIVKLKKRIENETQKDTKEKKEETADDHPIIKSARKRLGK